MHKYIQFSTIFLITFTNKNYVNGVREIVENIWKIICFIWDLVPMLLALVLLISCCKVESGLCLILIHHIYHNLSSLDEIKIIKYKD